jgi:hypothetical protein
MSELFESTGVGGFSEGPAKTKPTDLLYIC